MTAIESIEHQLKQVSPSELLQFYRWFSVFDADTWKTEHPLDDSSSSKEYNDFIHEKSKLLEASLKGDRAFSKEEFDFMVKHSAYKEHYRSAFCDPHVVKVLNQFGGVLDATELKFEELDEIIKETEIKEKNAAGKN